MTSLKFIYIRMEVKRKVLLPFSDDSIGVEKKKGYLRIPYFPILVEILRVRYFNSQCPVRVI